MGVIILVIIVGVIVICLFDTDGSCSSFKDEKELIECLNLTDEEIQRAKQLDEEFVNEDNLDDTEKLGYNIGMTMMVVGFATHLVFLRYILFKSYDLIFFQRIGYYFGLFNLWCALIALVLICVSFVCHRYEAKRRYMNNVCEKIEEFYEKEKTQSK